MAPHTPANPHDRATIRAFFGGIGLVEPGLVFIPEWHPDDLARFVDHLEHSQDYAGVAHKP